MNYITFSGVFFFLSFELGSYKSVEASRGDIIPLGQLYGSAEQRHIKNSQIGPYIGDSREYEKAEFPVFRKRKTKKKHKAPKKKSYILPNSLKDAKHKRGKGSRSSKRFLKITERDEDKDSNFSNSDENKKIVKPVDIIVHIKMKD